MTNRRISKRTIAFSTGFATAVIVVYMIIMVRNIELPIYPYYAVAGLISCIMGWLVSGYRLKILHKILDGRENLLPMSEYFKARIVGGFMAYITPSGIGGEPARAYYLSYKLNSKFSRYFSIVIIEPIYDILTVNTIALGFIIYAWPLSILVLIIAIGNIAFWLTFYYIMKNLIKPESIKPPLNRFVKFVLNYVRKHERIYSGYEEFAKAFRETTDKMGFIDKFVVILLTLTYQFLFGLTGFFIYLSYGYRFTFKGLIDSVIGYLFSNALTSIPTPGGSISAEYGLSLVLPPNVVLLTRIILYYTPIILGIYYLRREKIIESIVLSE